MDRRRRSWLKRPTHHNLQQALTKVVVLALFRRPASMWSSPSLLLSCPCPPATLTFCSEPALSELTSASCHHSLIKERYCLQDTKEKIAFLREHGKSHYHWLPSTRIQLSSLHWQLPKILKKPPIMRRRYSSHMLCRRQYVPLPTRTPL